jgi:hypothetical protein
MDAFANSLQHLLACLERVDLMVRSRVAHLRSVHAEDENFRGLYISEQEVDALLERPIGEPHWLHAGDEQRIASIDEALAKLAKDIDERALRAREQGVDLRLGRLQGLFGLDAFEIDVLLVCLAVELDLRYEKLYAYLQDDVTRKRPCVELLLRLLCPQAQQALIARRCFHDASRLLAHRLIRLQEEAGQPQPPLLAKVARVDTRIVQFLLGADDLDETLRDAVKVRVPAHGFDRLDADDALRGRLLSGFTASAEAGAPVVLLRGEPGSGRRSLVEAACHAHGSGLLVAELSALAFERDAAAPPLADHVARVEREALLRGAAVLWIGLPAAEDDARRTERAAIGRLLDEGRVPCFVASSRQEPGLTFPKRGEVIIDLGVPSTEQRCRAWKRALSGTARDAGLDAEAIAGRFRLNHGQIHQAARTAARLAAQRPGACIVTQDDLFEACRLHSNQRLASLARKVHQHYRWVDLVLPNDQTAQLREICNHVRYHGRVYGEWGFARKLVLGKGLAALFSGPSGTGKTMAAGIIASELGLELYKVDLSTVISKYIGETEKNLSRIFDEAETSNAILFFDEADALFGKRSEVRDSHDRYANVEVGYLLQRMEEYEGIAILATNLRKNMDDAFMRRLHFTVEFPFPDEDDRYRIWQGVWPADTPRDAQLDLRFMAERFEMTGGNIKNVALAAAFLAADEAGVVQTSHLVRATQREFQKTGKLIDRFDDGFHHQDRTGH